MTSRRGVKVYAALAAATAAGLGALAPVWPAVLLAPVMLVVLVCIIVRPKMAAIATAVIVLFVQTGEAVTHITAIGYLDDLAIVALGLIILTMRLINGKLRSIPGGLWLLLFIVAGLLSGVLRDVPVTITGAGLLLLAKGPFFAITVAQLDWMLSDVRRIARLALAILGVLLISALINAAVPIRWGAIFNPKQFAARGGALPTLTGPFLSPGAFGQIMVLSVAALVAVAVTYGRQGRRPLLVAAAIVGCLLTFRRRALVSLVAAGVAATSRPGRSRAGQVIGGAILLTIAILLLSDTISNVVAQTRIEYTNPAQARTVLYRGSARLSRDYFPLGAGFGRYGDHVSGTSYSPEYARIGIANIYGLGPTAGGSSDKAFFTDTFWPAALGETGVVGTVGYLAFVVMILRKGRQLTTDEEPMVQALGLTLSAWSVAYFVDSLASPIYVSPPTYALLFGLVGLAAAIRPSGGDPTIKVDPPDPLTLTTPRWNRKLNRV